MSVNTNERMIFGDINSRLPFILDQLINGPGNDKHKDNIVFVCRNITEAKSLQSIAARILANYDVYCRYAATGKIDTGCWGVLHFVPMSQAACRLRGLSMTTAYLDLSQKQIDDNEQTITNIHIQTLFTNNEWNDTHESQLNKESDKSKTIDNYWSRFTRWIREGW